MSRTLSLLIASTLAAGVIAACSAGPDSTGSLYGGTMGHSGTPAAGNTAGSGDPGNGNTGNTNGATPPASTPPSTGGNTGPTQPPPAAGPGSAGSLGHQNFVANVYPLLVNCQGCHASGANGAPKMMEPDASLTYQELDARGLIVTNSLLLTKGVHGGGAAPALSTAQQSAIQGWLSIEATDRAGQAAPTNILAQLGNCLDQTLFDNIGFQNLKTVPRTGENPNRCTGCDNANCRVCHTAGDNGFYEALGSNIDQGTFAATKTPQYIVTYLGLNGVTPVASNVITQKAAAVATGAPYTHPMFTLDATFTANLNAFVQDAITKYNNHTCGTTAGASDAGTD